MPKDRPGGKELHYRRSIQAISQALQEVSDAARTAAGALVAEPCGPSPEIQSTTRAVLTSIYSRYAFLEQLAGAIPGDEPAKPLVPSAPGLPAPRTVPRNAWQRAAVATTFCRSLAAVSKVRVREVASGAAPLDGGPPTFAPPSRVPAAAAQGIEEDTSTPASSSRAPCGGASGRGSGSSWEDFLEDASPSKPCIRAGVRVRRSVDMASQAVELALAYMEGSRNGAASESSPPVSDGEWAQEHEDETEDGEEEEQEETRKKAPEDDEESGSEDESGSQDSESEDDIRQPSLPRRRSARVIHADIGTVDPELVPLRLLRRCFESCDAKRTGRLTPSELALVWGAATSSRRGQPLKEEDRALIAADVQRFFSRVDVFQNGSVRMDEWLHYALLEAHPPGQADLTAINARLRHMDDGAVLSDIVRMWEVADPEGTGLVPRAEIERALELAGLSIAKDPDAALGADPSSPRVSYAEFCAYQLKLEFTPVELLYYDLSKQVGKYLSPVLLWRLEEGIWHTGIVVYGSEYFYYGDILRADPGNTPFGKPTKKRKLGVTLRSREDFHCHVARTLHRKFNGDTYDVFTNNCNHCCDALVGFLLGRHVPDQVRFLPDRVMGTPIAKMLQPLLNKWLRGSGDDDKSGTSVTELCGHEGGRTAMLKRGRVHEDVAHSFYKAGGGAVLYEAPGVSEPLVAHVIKEDLKGGRADIEWLDHTGNRQVVRGVRTNLLKPYMLDAKGTSNIRVTYVEALEALSDPEAATEVASRATRHTSRACLTLREFISAPVTVCLKGHGLVQAKDGIISGWRSRKCDECGRSIPRGERRMACVGGCRYDICQGCWEGRAGGLRALLRGRCMGRCPGGHSLERLFGQGVRGEAACKKCGTKELGAVFPFFLCCRLCHYDVCPPCAARDA